MLASFFKITINGTQPEVVEVYRSSTTNRSSHLITHNVNEKIINQYLSVYLNHKILSFFPCRRHFGKKMFCTRRESLAYCQLSNANILFPTSFIYPVFGLSSPFFTYASASIFHALLITHLVFLPSLLVFPPVPGVLRDT